jgi:hypothetical protein
MGDYLQEDVMTRTVIAVSLAALLAAPLVAQAPEGWMMRADKSTSATDPDAPGEIKFMAMGRTLHAVNPTAAVYWSPKNTATGNYTLKGTFTLVKPSSHTNYYGLVFGGSNLEGPKQTYTYFLVAQNGSWLIKRRNGDAATEDIVPRTPNAAVQQPDSSGKSKNTLEVRVTGDKVEYIVNGTTVHTAPKSSVTTDGIYGIRVNHQLEVLIDDFGVSKT